MTIIPGIEQFPALAAWMVAVLTAYGTRTAQAVVEHAADGTKDAIVGAARGLWAKLKAHFQGDAASTVVLAALEALPESEEAQEDLKNLLALRLKHDAELLEALRPLLEELRQLEAKIEAAGGKTVYQSMSNTGPHSVNVQTDGSGHNINVQR
jgi:hypothetical protein